jgi:thiol-disulfide isomerase/thioredoxin
LYTAIAVVAIIAVYSVYLNFENSQKSDNLLIALGQLENKIDNIRATAGAADQNTLQYSNNPTDIFQTFYVTNNPILKEDGKPVIIFFGTTQCPHCSWISPTFEKVAREYMDAGKIAAYHWQLDSKDDALTLQTRETAIPKEHIDIYHAFNPRSTVPTFVLGAKYYRIGNAYESEKNEAEEEKAFRAAIEELLKED